MSKQYVEFDTADTETDRTTDAEIDRLFDALAAERRRHVLSCLDERERPMARADLADEVATRENGGGAKPSRSEVAAVYQSLFHVHVPKLVDAGLVEYDHDANGVKLVSEAYSPWERVKQLASP